MISLIIDFFVNLIHNNIFREAFIKSNIIKLILFFGIIFISCAKTERYIKTCKDVTCSKNATCEVIDDEPICSCNDNFKGNGKTCLKIENFSWRKTLGGIGYDEGKIITHDKDNNIYVAGSFSGDVNFDTEDGIDIHSSGYSCNKKPKTCPINCDMNQECNYETLECICKLGYHFDEQDSTICVIDECDTECDENEICSNNNCICKENFHLNQGINLQCVKDFTCLNQCRENEKCDNGICICQKDSDKTIYNNSFLMKFKEDGTYLWTKTISSINDNQIVDIAIKNNKLYLLGSFKGEVDFNPSDGVDIKNGEENRTNTFLLELTNSGSYIKTTTLPIDDPKSIIINSHNDIYIAGSFTGEVDFDPSYSSDIHISKNNSHDIFLTKMKTDGSYLWTKTIGGDDYDGVSSVAIDSKEDIYIVGGFNKIVDFNPTDGIDEHTSNGSIDIFITKFNFAGIYQWTKTLGSTNYDMIEDAIIDNEDNILVIGSFSDNLAISDTKGYDSNGLADIFVSKLNKDGNFLWTKIFGGPQWEINGSIAIDNLNNVYVTGGFMDNITFDDNINRVSLGGYDIFMAKLDKDGKYLWGQTIGGNNDENSMAIDIDNKNNILITGNFWEDIILETTSESFTSNGDTDIFIFKIK